MRATLLIAVLLAGGSTVLSLAAWPTLAQAQSPDPAEDVRRLERSDAAKSDAGITPAPDIRTRRDEQGTEFREYRVAGQMSAVKVTPKRGAPYWLIQRDGIMRRVDGPGQASNITVPTWLVLEW
ncbi:hypothetical protein BH10PSE17_BH10PSE17_27730 [soil metagenome]